jgi:hypothetical protein
MSSLLSGPGEASKPKLLDQIRQLMPLRHYSLRTEEAYVGWRVKAAPTRQRSGDSFHHALRLRVAVS